MANWSPDRQQAVQARCEDRLGDHAHTPMPEDRTICLICELRRDGRDALAQIRRQQADLALARLAEVGKERRDSAERLLSAIDWAGDISEWNYDGSWTARKDWRTVILDALFPKDAKEAARE